MKKTILLIGYILLINGFAFSQTASNSELNKIIEASFNYFPAIKESLNAEKTAEEKLKMVEMNKLPDFSVTGTYNYMMPKISFPINGNEIQFAPVNSFNSSINTNYTIVDFGRLKASIEKSKFEIQNAKHNTAAAQMQLAQQVASIYYSIVYLKKSILVQDSVISYLQQNKKVVDNKILNGESYKIDALTLQSTLDAERNKKLDLLSQLQKQINLLEYTSGFKTIVGNNFDFNSADINNSQIDSTKALANPDFLLLSDKTILAQKELFIIKTKSRPSVGLHGAGGYKNGFVPDVNDMRFNYYGGVSFMLPLDLFGKTKQQLKVQQSIIKQSELATQSFENKNNKDIKDILSDIEINALKIKNTESQIASADKAEQIIALKYQNGIATYLDVVAASTAVQKAALSKLQCEYQQTLNYIYLNKLRGIEFWK